MPDQPPPHSSELHLYLSPHLDDAILSCGGQMQQLVKAGHTVVVYTLMAGRPPRHLPQSPILQDLHTRWGTGSRPVDERRREDIRALQTLGVIARHGTLPDCVYRLTYSPGGDPVALYPSEESLWADIHPADPAVPLLEAMPLPYPQAAALHVPLGAGQHVDHRLVRDWGQRQARVHSGLTVLYYEEYPYSIETDAVETALAHFFASQPLQSVTHILEEAALQAKITAITLYQSQISTFWQDTGEMARAVRAYACQVGSGQPAEREWQVDSRIIQAPA